MFWGLVASSATICTNWVRAFWYCSNTAGRDTVEGPPGGPQLPPPAVGAPAPGPTLHHLPLTHGARSSPPATTSGATLFVCAGPASPRGRGDCGGHSASNGTLSSVYPRLPGNRPEPQRGGLAATVSLGRDVTVSGPRARMTGPGGLRLQGRPRRAKRAQPLHELCTVGCHYPAGSDVRPQDRFFTKGPQTLVAA